MSERKSSGRARDSARRSLRDRRRSAQYKLLLACAVVLVLAIAGVFCALWQPALRVRQVDASGPDADGARTLAQTALGGTYQHLLPKNSIFLLPEARIRASILDAYPDIVAVSIAGEQFDAIKLTLVPRTPAFWWCGGTFDQAVGQTSCYDSDSEGLIFEPATTPDGETSSTTLRVFAPTDAADASSSPIRSHVRAASHVPDALRFVKAVKSLGVPVIALAIHDDEADVWVTNTTRLTYVLGHEEAAAQLAAATLPTLVLTDGSIQYVDLRFDKKVYVKRNGS